MAEILRHSEHAGPFEQFMDKGVKRAGLIAAIGFGIIANWPAALIGAYIALSGDIFADIAAKVRIGNSPVIGDPSKAHH